MQSGLIGNLAGGLEKAFDQNVLPNESGVICLGVLYGEALAATQRRVPIPKAR